jgi:predicted  nucleic acid-binding Zn-ribbon protein
MSEGSKTDDRNYSQLDSLTSSDNTEISRLSLIVKNLKERLESLEKSQTGLLDKLNRMQKEIESEDGDNEE